jgi:uncharacterized protein (TIGR02246 family)
MPDSDTALEQIIRQQETAWNTGDGLAWASAFTDDADYVNVQGDVFQGREEIARQHVFILGGPYKGSHLRIRIRKITEPAPNVAIIETEYDLTGFNVLAPGIAPTAPGVLRSRMKYVALKQGDQWSIIAAQNTAILPTWPKRP